MTDLSWGLYATHSGPVVQFPLNGERAVVSAIEHYNVDYVVVFGRPGGNPLFARGWARYRGDHVVARVERGLPATLEFGAKVVPVRKVGGTSISTVIRGGRI